MRHTFLYLLTLASLFSTPTAQATEISYPIMASSHAGSVIFVKSDNSGTHIQFIECHLADLDLQKPLLSLAPKGRTCIELGTLLNSNETLEKFDQLFTAYMKHKSVEAGYGLHTVAYLVSTITGLATLGYVGLGTAVGDGAMALKQSWPWMAITAVVAGVGYYWETQALQRARAEEATLEYAIRHRQLEVLNNENKNIDPELLKNLDEVNLAESIYNMFKASLLASLETMNGA